MESGGGSGHRSALACVDGLVALAVGGGIGARDVGWKRDVADGFHFAEEIVGGRETNVAFPEIAASDDFGLKLIVVPEKKMLADGDLAAGADQAFPFVRILTQMAREEDFDASMQELASGRIIRADGLGMQASTAAVKTGWKHAGVVEHDKVVWTEQFREVAELAVLESSAARRDMQQAGSGAIGERLLGDQVFGQIVVKIGDKHAIDYKNKRTS
jgi:hypothetical protein